VNSKKVGTIAGVIVAGIIALACSSGGGEGDGEDVAAPNSSAAPAAAAQKAKIGTAVRDGKFEFVVKSMKCNVDKAGKGFLTSKAKGDYCLVQLTVKNIGDESQLFAPSNMIGIKGKTEYTPDSTASLYATGEGTWVDQLNPGVDTTATVAYDVPSDLKLDAIRLHDSMLSDGVVVSLK
jgi:hypothetical protein